MPDNYAEDVSLKKNVEELMLVLKVISVGFCSFQIFQLQIIKKGEAEARNEASRDHRHAFLLAL